MAMVDTGANATMAAAALEAPAFRPMSTKPNWPHALKALRRLLNDKEDTTAVFEIMRALNGSSTAKGYLRLLETQQGGRIAFERQEFAGRLMDDAWLDSLPQGSVGAAYRHFIRSEDISADGLIEISRQNAAHVDEQHPYAWMGRRTRDIHDVWHILSGYHRDGLGEACLVAFSFAQTGGLGWALIALGAGSRARKAKTHPYVQAIWQGYRRGKAAKWLLGEDYERLMSEPLESARRRLNLTPATIYDAIPPEARDQSLPKAA
jgi:ubiquinone biosynthesis protein COQ4